MCTARQKSKLTDLGHVVPSRPNCHVLLWSLPATTLSNAAHAIASMIWGGCMSSHAVCCCFFSHVMLSYSRNLVASATCLVSLDSFGTTRQLSTLAAGQLPSKNLSHHQFN